MSGKQPELGLALGGGATLGWAHVGVLTALEEAGVQPDAVAGTSSGALAAALYAFDVSPARMEELLGWPRWKDLTGVTLSSLGLFSNRAVVEPLEEELGDARIEEARLPLAVVASDINSGERVEFERVRTLVGVLVNAFLMAVHTGARHELERHADVIVKPDLGGYHYSQLAAREEIRERGRDAGRRAVEPIRAALRRAGADE